MEEGLLRAMSSNVDGDPVHVSETMPSGSPPSVTIVVVLSPLVAFCGSLSVGCATGYSSAAESGIVEDLDLSLAAYSVFGSTLTVGGMIGGLLNGKMADVIGRIAMGVSAIFSSAGWLTIAFAKNAWWLDTGRLSVGFGAGIIHYVAPVYIAEITPKELRGRFTSANQFMITCGFSLFYFIGNAISWRTIVIIGAIPTLLQIIGLFFIPESPRWLAEIGKQKDLEATLQHLRGTMASVSQEAVDIMDYTEMFQQHSGRMLDLFQMRYAQSLTIGVGLMFLQQFSGSNGTAYYGSSIFIDAGESKDLQFCFT